jgi:AcrR family transcriptional regulator
VPRVGLSTAAVVDAAIELVDAEGPETLTLTAVAKHAGVATPSLYKHIPSLGALRDLIAQRVVEDLRDTIASAVLGRSRDDAIRAAMRAYRAYIVAHPRRYALFPQAPPQNPRLAAATAGLLEVVLVILRGYGLDGTAEIHAARAFRTIVHGFASLEAAGGFGLPIDLDATYDHLVRLLIDGIPRM